MARLATWLGNRRAEPSPFIEQDGILIPVDDPHVKGRIREVMAEGVYESGDVRAMKELIEPGDVVMEVGGGIGFVSALAAKLVGSDRVHTYEPNPVMEASIRRLYQINDVSPHLMMAAVSDKDGTARLTDEPDFWDARLGDKGVEVPAVRFADELQRVEPTFVMMDCEGSEAQLLGPIRLPDSVRKVVAELHPELIGLEACTAVIRAMLDQEFILRLDLCGGSLWSFVRTI
jgi:FkbM family methyltransferase